MESIKLTLPGVSDESTLFSIYRDLKAGRVLTSLDAINEYKTCNLVKYLSILRLEYGINVQSRWISLPSNKRIKEFYITE